MKPAEEIELTIRAAQVAKDALALVGVKDQHLARLMMQRLAENVVALSVRIEELEP